MSSQPSVSGGIRATYEALWSDGRGWIFSSLAVSWLFSLGARLSFPTLLPSVRETFGFDLTAAGLLLAVLWGAYAIAQFPGGLIADRIGERNLLTGSTLLATVMLGAVSVATDVRFFFAATTLFGLSIGLFATTKSTVLTDIYPDRRSTAMGLVSSAGNLGAMALPVVSGFVATAVGWRYGFGGMIPFLLATAVGFWVFVPRRTSTGVKTDRSLSVDTFRSIYQGISRPAVLRGTGAMLFVEIIYQGFTGFYPTYLVIVKGLDQRTAALLFGVYFGVGILVQPLGGGLDDRFGTRRVTVGALAIGMAGLAALPFISGVLPLAALTIVASGQLAFWPGIQTYVIGALPEQVQGSGFGLVRSTFLLISAGAPIVVGALGDAGYFDGAMFLLAGFAFIGIVLCASLPVPDD